jgi:hypothetical protein
MYLACSQNHEWQTHQNNDDIDYPEQEIKTTEEPTRQLRSQWAKLMAQVFSLMMMIIDVPIIKQMSCWVKYTVKCLFNWKFTFNTLYEFIIV